MNNNVKLNISRKKKYIETIKSLCEYHLSTPVTAYLFLLLLTIIMLLIGIIMHCGFTLNVGYSLLASLVAAIFIDIGNTRTIHESEKRQFNIMKEEIVYAFRNLRDSVDMSYSYWYESDTSKKSFQSRVSCLLSPKLTITNK